MTKILYKIIYVLFIISLLILGYEIFTLDLLPNKYLVPIIIILGIILILITLGFIFFKKKPLKIIISIIEILFVIVSTVGTIYIHTTNNFFKNFQTDKTETNIYYLIVDKSSKYEKINDLEDKTIGMFQKNKKAIKEISKQIDFKEKILNTVIDVQKQISQIDSILLNSAYYDLICDENENFDKEVRIIEKIEITSKNSLETKDINITDEPFSILISGIDTEGPIYTTSRSDVNIVMTVNPKTHKILLTHIPRDYYVNLHGITESKDKLTHAGVYGIDMSVQTIEDLLDIDINYYLRVNFDTLVKVVDAVGGVDVVSDRTFSEYGYTFTKGTNHLDGQHALMYARIRHVLPGGDRFRGKHQEEIIDAIIQKVSSSEIMLKNYRNILNSLSDSFQTNITPKNMKKIVKYQINEMYSWQTDTINLDGTSSSDYCYSYPGQKLYVMIPDENTVEVAKTKIKEYLK